MAFISEVNFRGGSGIAGGEFVEVTLEPGESASDFVVSVYSQTGQLHTGAGISGGQVTLSSLTGTPDPDNPGYIVYVIPVGIRNANSTATEGSGIALTDTSTGGGVVSFYSADNIPSFTAAAGAANGALSESILEHTSVPDGDSYQWGLDGVLYFAPISEGTVTLCLTGDAMVRTASGEIAAENLCVGDLVLTQDHGAQPIRWIGTSTHSPKTNSKDNPVCIPQNALANGIPSQDLFLSPQHRVLIRSVVAERMFDAAEIFTAAKRLIGVNGIHAKTPAESVTYYHLLLDHHEIILANGAPVESLLIAPQSAAALNAGGFVTSNNKLFPAEFCPLANIAARPIPKGTDIRTMLARISKNGKPLIEKQRPELWQQAS